MGQNADAVAALTSYTWLMAAPSGRGNYAAVLSQQTEDALVLATGASEAYTHGCRAWAGVLHAAAERSHSVILAGTANLTDDEADQLEPTVTRLEYQLRRLWPFWRGQPDLKMGYG